MSKFTNFADLFIIILNRSVMNEEKEKGNILEEVTSSEYKYGFVTDIETETAPVGLTEDTIHYISNKKNEPKWLLDYRLKAFRYWLTIEEPDWA